jgi:hypothetical protein
MAMRRINRGATGQQGNIRALKDLVDETGSAIAEIERLQELVKQNIPRIEIHMKEAAQLEFRSPNGSLAHYVTPASRATSHIDPEGFKKLVSEKDFMASVTVTKGKAEQFIGKKELDKITTKTPPAKKDPVLKVEKP